MVIAVVAGFDLSNELGARHVSTREVVVKSLVSAAIAFLRYGYSLRHVTSSVCLRLIRIFEAPATRLHATWVTF